MMDVTRENSGRAIRPWEYAMACRQRKFWAGAGLGAVLIATLGQPVAAAMRIVDADATVQSSKRGVAANYLSAGDFAALAPGVSWWYNWSPQPNQPVSGSMQFIPMVWNNDPGSMASLQSYLTSQKVFGALPRQVLALNEPNLKGQAFLTPQDAATAYLAVKAIADGFGVPVSAPQMALGSAADSSITAYDPIQHKTVTYTDMASYVQAFDYYAGTSIAGGGFHTYGDINELKWSVGNGASTFGRPLAVTEYAWWNAPDTHAALQYLVQATDYLEASPQVASYSWFKERDNSNSMISLLTSQSGQLTALGQAYVMMPVHDADLYYRASGRLEAERYVGQAGAQINLTDDTDGFTQMTATLAGGWLDYNIFADQAGAYDLALRIEDAGTVRIWEDGAVLATVDADQSGWQTLLTQVDLPAGAQTLRIELRSVGQSINWMSFDHVALVPEPASLGLLAVGGLALLRRRKR